MGFAQDAYRFITIMGGVFIVVGAILPWDVNMRIYGILLGAGLLAIGLLLRKLYWSGRLPRF